MGKIQSYKNKYFSILGDSISTLEGYSQPKDGVYYDLAHKIEARIIAAADTWWGRVIEELDGKLLVNNSISGSTVCYSALYEQGRYGCSDARTSALDKDGISPDVIIVYLGTNDWGAGGPITAAQGCKADLGNLSYFANAYAKMLEKLQDNYPNAEIWCLTLPICDYGIKEGGEFPYHYGGRHIKEYCGAIKKCAAEYACRVIDLYALGIIYQAADGLHPNKEGMQTLAQAILNELKS